jgi:hypothetical protein
MTHPPLTYEWTGESFKPATPFHATQADRYFVVGGLYHLSVEEPRSTRSHRHYFAAIREAWLNLSEEQTMRWPSPDALRKWALIACGYRSLRSIACSSRHEATKMAAFLKPLDPYSLVSVNENIVLYATALSQTQHGANAMDKETFEQSKKDVLDCISAQIAVSAETLMRNTERAC